MLNYELRTIAVMIIMIDQDTLLSYYYTR